MKFLATFLVAALAAFAAQRWGSAYAAQSSDREDASPSDEGRELTLVLAGIQDLRHENERLAQELERRAEGLAAASAPETDGEAGIGAALARWRAEHPEVAQALAAKKSAPPVHVAPGELDFQRIPMLELVQALANEGLTHLEKQAVFQRLRDAGRIDEYVAAIEKLAAEDPDNVDLQVALGHAYLQKLFGVNSPEQQGTLAFASDAAFDRALALDDENWSARFSKAISLSNWPAFMGRGPEAIEHFELLLEQQSAQTPRPEFAMTYVFLGNMLQAAGEREEAIATWREGLKLFPDTEDLKRALELADGERDARR